MNTGNRKTIFSLIAVGIILGMALTLLVEWGVYGVSTLIKSKKDSPAGTEISEDYSGDESGGENESKDTVSEEKSDAEAGTADTWNAEAQYNSGDEVIFGGNVYKAKWWSQGEEPDKNNPAGAWEFVKEAKSADKTGGKDDKEEPEDEEVEKPIAIENPKVSTEDFKVVGYYPEWEPDKMDHINFDVITNIMYAFAIPTSEGELLPLENKAFAKKLINEAHKHGVKVSVAVGGWSYKEIPLEPTFVSATNTDEKIKKLGDSIMDLVHDVGFDGVDMDWEHPRKDDNSKVQYEKLMVYLSEQLHKEGKILTSAVLSGATPDGNVYYDAAAHSDKVLEAVDWLNVMAYDGGDGERHSSYQFAVDSANYWHKTRNMPAHKVVLGMPFYGRPSWQTYEAILEANPDAYKTDISMINGMEAHYNGVDTIKKKTEFAKENIGGVMIWELSQDTTDKKKSLQAAIGDVIE